MSKVEKIKDWISKTQDGLMDTQGNFGYPEHEGAYHILCNLDAYINSLEEEPVSNDLEEAARRIATLHSHISGDTYYANDAWFFKKGAQWQKANLWKDAQGNDLPEIDREVIVLVKSLPEHEDSLLKVSFAHRPPEYWMGKNISTGEITRYEPKRYDKGGWNQPNVVYWLDVELPKEEE